MRALSLVVVMLLAPAASARPVSRPGCLAVLRIDAPEAAREALRAALPRSSLATPELTARCRAVYVRVVDAPGGQGWEVRLEQGDRAVQRRVASLDDAAVWLESWLATGSGGPPPEPPSTSPPTIAARAAPAIVAPASPAQAAPTARRREVRLELLGLGGLATDATMWTGSTLAGELQLTRLLWLGASAGLTFNPGHEVGDGSRRSSRSLHAVVRAGVRLPLGRRDRVVLRVGAGMGLAWTWSVTSRGAASTAAGNLDEQSTGEETGDAATAALAEHRDGGAFLAELEADLLVRLARRLSLVSGFGFSALLARGLGEAPAGIGELHLGLSYSFGAR